MLKHDRTAVTTLEQQGINRAVPAKVVPGPFDLLHQQRRIGAQVAMLDAKGQHTANSADMRVEA